MRDLNSVIIGGRVGQDIELRTAGNGKYVTSFNLACAYDTYTTWIKCVAWDKTAEAVHKYAHKGDRVVVQGRLSQRDWTDKEGNERVSYEITIEKIVFSDSKRETPKPEPAEYQTEESDELPF